MELMIPINVIFVKTYANPSGRRRYEKKEHISKGYYLSVNYAKKNIKIV